jgi:predicted DCC family thiol-disulfide oxidoreductase YuxK
VIVVFDGVCNLCNFWVRFVAARDPGRQVRFASMQSPAGEALLARHGYRAAGLDTLLVIESGILYVKTDAIARVLARLGGFWRFLSLLLRCVSRPVRDWLYTRVALNRYRLFGRREVCALPSASLATRFVHDAEDVPPSGRG